MTPPTGLPDGPTEDSTARDGLLSYSGEWHALLIGAAAGFAAAAGGRPELAAAVAAVALGGAGVEAAAKRLRGRGVVAEISREPWYAIAGVAIGYVLGAVATGAALATLVG